MWRGLHLRVRTDNMAALAGINNTTSRSKDLMLVIRELFWYSVKYDFRLTASFIPGKLNVLSDRVSRLDEPLAAVEAFDLLSVGNTVPVFAVNHMSKLAFLTLQATWKHRLMNF